MISLQRVFSAEYADSLAKDLLAKQFVPSGVQTVNTGGLTSPSGRKY